MNSSPLDVQTLAVRIEKLEAANRRWKSASAIALLSLLSLLLLTRHAERVAAAARPDRVEQDVLRVRAIEAQDFVLKDEDGHIYARLSLGPALMAKLQPPNGPSTVPRYSLPKDQLPAQATLQFYNENGEILWTAPTKPEFVTVK